MKMFFSNIQVIRVLYITEKLRFNLKKNKKYEFKYVSMMHVNRVKTDLTPVGLNKA